MWRERAIWSRERTAPLRAFLPTESGSAGVRFWEMHDLLPERQEDLTPTDLVRYAADLDLGGFHDDVTRHVHETRVAQDVESADLSGATGTPTFFVNGQRQYGADDLDSLTAAVTTAGALLNGSAGGSP